MTFSMYEKQGKNFSIDERRCAICCTKLDSAVARHLPFSGTDTTLPNHPLQCDYTINPIITLMFMSLTHIVCLYLLIQFAVYRQMWMRLWHNSNPIPTHSYSGWARGVPLHYGEGYKYTGKLWEALTFSYGNRNFHI